MYFTALPDHSQPDFDEELHFSRFRRQNIIFNALSSKSYCERHVGCLSIKTVFSGEEWYGVDGRQLAVRPGRFLILNNDQEYSCRINTTDKIRVQSVFFRTDFAATVFQDAITPEAWSLDNPFETGVQPEFFQTLTDTDPVLEQNLLDLTTALDTFGYDSTRVDERLVFLFYHLIRIQKKQEACAEQVNAIRPATRTEIYKRLCIAKDLLHSSFMDKPDLSAISQAACLSVPQLVRQFKAVFHTTPHQYLNRIRLAQAARWLQDTTMPVHEITWKCGFENTSAFCRVFKTVYGIPPGDYRRGQ